jgi:hypothetical protein
MFFEILLGAGSGYFLRQLYYDYVFTPYPAIRMTGVSALLPFVGALALAWAADSVYRVLKMPFRGWTKGPFWNRGLGLSLFAGAFLQIEAAKVASEYRLDAYATAGVVGVWTFLLAWTWVRHLRYKSLLATMPDDSPSMLLAEAAKTVRGGKESSPTKRKERSVKSASASSTNPSKRKREERAPSVDDVWAAFDKEIRSRSRAQVTAEPARASS